MTFDAAAGGTCASVQGVQSENVLSIPRIHYSPSTLEQRQVQFNNYALSIDEFGCSQYRKSTYMSPLLSYVSNTTGCSNVDMHVLANGNHNLASQFIDVDTKRNDHSVRTSHVSDRTCMPFDMLCNNGWALSLSCFPHHIFHPEEPKPQQSYIGLIAMAILNSAETKLVLSDIYQYILDNYPYFRTRGPGWRNSIRHNLSLNDCFIKSGRSSNGKGHYWAIHPANIDDFRKGDFRRRKAQRKVRKHMGLPLDAANPDSPSPPPSQADLASQPPPLGSVSPLRIVPATGSISETSYEFPQVHNGVSLNNIQQKHQLQHYHPLMPSSQVSFPHGKNRQQIHGSYFDAAFMEHYMSVPPSFYNTNRRTTSILSHKQCSTFQNNKMFNSLTHNNALLLLAQQRTCDSVSMHETSKQFCFSRTAAKSSSSATASIVGASTEKRKRQFDVASLLAPDLKDSKTTSKELHSTEEGVFTLEQRNLISDEDHQISQNDSSQHGQQLLHRQLVVSSSVQKQILLTRDDQEEEEIVDVVASDIDKKDLPLIVVDKENDIYVDKIHVKNGNQTFIGNNRSCEDVHIYNDCSLPTRSNLVPEKYIDTPKVISNSTADFQTCYASKIISSSSSTHLVPVLSKTVKAGSSMDCVSSENPNNGVHQMQLYSHLNAGNPIASHSIAHRHKHVKRLIHQLHKQSSNLEKLDDLNVQAFGHYYGTYMAAAAAHVEAMQRTELQQEKRPMEIQQKLEHQQQ